MHTYNVNLFRSNHQITSVYLEMNENERIYLRKKTFIYKKQNGILFYCVIKKKKKT